MIDIIIKVLLLIKIIAITIIADILLTWSKIDYGEIQSDMFE